MFKRTHYSIITGLDIGADTLKVLVTMKNPEEDDLEVLAQIERPCTGAGRGVVVKPEKVAEGIDALVDEAQNVSGQRIDSVFANIDGSHVIAVFSRGTVAVSRADREISQEDIDRVIHAAKKVILPSNKEIIDIFPKEFIIDGEAGIKEALGMKGTRLETEVILLCGLSPYLHNLTKAISSAGLQLIGIQSSPIAASRSVLTPQQKELGVALIDIGSTTTSLAVFEDETLIHAAIFPVGAAHITHDIAIGLRCDIDLAEKIKKEFGTCILKREKGQKYKRDKIKISDSVVFSRKMLVRIIEARVSEILELVNRELKKTVRQKLLPAGIVLTGGGAKLPKIVELTKKELKLPCQIGKPKGFIGLDEDPSLATVCGLVLEGIDSEGKGHGFPVFNRGKGITGKLKKIFKVFIP